LPRPAEIYVIESQPQLRVLTSMVRQEIVDVLAQMGTASVAEVAATLGRPPDSLYYHLRALQKAGLVLPAGVRRRSRRQEVLFRTVAPELMLRYQPGHPPNRKAVTAIVGSMLRLGFRDFRRAFERPSVIVSGNHRELWALRRTGWLSPAQVATVNRSIQQLSRNVAKSRGQGQLYAITVVLTPLEQRRGRRLRRTDQETGSRISTKVSLREESTRDARVRHK
jgi:DNA-binding transcriptional ArsR family regulator